MINILALFFIIHLYLDFVKLTNRFNSTIYNYSEIKKAINYYMLESYQFKAKKITKEYYVKNISSNDYQKFSDYYKKNKYTLIIRIPEGACENCILDFFMDLKKYLNKYKGNNILVITSNNNYIYISKFLHRLGLYIKVLGVKSRLGTDLSDDSISYLYLLSNSGESNYYAVIYKHNINFAFDYFKLVIKKFKLLSN